MTIKQLSVFLENKTGRINEVVRTLGANDINMHAFSMAETADFGILRLIVSDVDKAVEVLRSHDFAVMSTDVVCLSCENVPGSLAVILEYLAQKQIFIEYMYAFAQNDRANVVIKPNDLTHCLEVLQAHHCDILTKDRL
ncbi:amino acid-binding ACT domain protein [Phocaeicola salanitronis DSM 18170]|uniref:Amino acid-binding ACT domain protein n=1 Tax=Phocaeicola salanitronis (strain DSM 18170 / JCM 13657 / CCUG 60908 / BL78) TaxID=667015 RepID=F0R383_PHOSB|nr:amino acid-binding protein [Phocaeicola salanitronis]ADY35492.1 amino acid-binding ACT domain protein [Phocaeicola salanitronis DSM 18170]